MNIMVERVKFLIYCVFHRNVVEKAEYLKKKKIFKQMGDNCRYAPYWIPADAKYISFHNNISISTGTQFICHDTINTLISHLDEKYEGKLPDSFTPIEIFDNVFLGGNVIICPGVKIGPNAIVAAGAVVTKDIPEGVIVGGVPAKVIGSFDEMVERRLKENGILKEKDYVSFK